MATTSASSVMDTYEMLGVKPTCTLKEVKKAYINMARICHPDKGGDASDMRILKSSYDWICTQLQQVALEANKGTYEEREAAYQEFIKQQALDLANKPLPSMTELEMMSESCIDPLVYGMIKTKISERFPNDAFLRDICLRRVFDYEGDQEMLNNLEFILDDVESINKNETMPSSIIGGYGGVLDPTEPTMSTTYPVDDPINQLPPPLPLPHTLFGKSQLIINKEEAPKAHCELTNVYGKQSGLASIPLNLPVPAQLDDYSIGESMCDYRAAYTDSYDMYNELTKIYDQGDAFNKTYEDILIQRGQLDDACKERVRERITLNTPQ